ncbi:universal stress protein [Actinoplanes sp. TRM 88003]|uniref:Universal stress protein n=1 Tax=Paractinoplanes aksuensis TaxID=2939490 RepID=A0ABT1DF26_9ACTN|nr:universal stress protein [Actinoplanes aksuensis]MCO8269423.1 universal stress protein [Actinoplanes aksuensis]
MIKSRIVVGVDGSDHAVAAVGWAAAEAARRGTELRVLAAYYRERSTPGSSSTRTAEGHAADNLRRAVAQAHAAAPGIEVKCLALPGYAVPMLVHASEEAAMVVVGSRHEGGLPVLPFGSVSSQVATQARCCVVVVRGHYDPDAGPVVAGVDGGVSSAVLGRAFEEASLHHTELEAVTVGDRRRPDDPLGADLDADLDPWREKYPGVRARREYVDGRADRVLVQRSRAARMVVVGPRTHGYEGLMLGSIGSRLLRRSACPVVVAR